MILVVLRMVNSRIFTLIMNSALTLSRIQELDQLNSWVAPPAEKKSLKSQVER